MKRDPLVFIEHVLECMDLIESYMKDRTEEDLEKDMQLQDAILHRLTIIGEAVKNIPDTIRDKNPDMPWRKIAGIKDVLVHHYFGVDLSAIWAVIQEDIPSLKEKLQDLKDKIAKNGNV